MDGEGVGDGNSTSVELSKHQVEDCASTTA